MIDYIVLSFSLLRLWTGYKSLIVNSRTGDNQV